MMESNLIILSSSTHEVLLMMDDGATEYEKLIEMVSYINATEVLETDVLSNSINQYNRQFEQLVMVP